MGALSVAFNTAADLLVVGLAVPIERKFKSSAKLRSRQRLASGLGMISLGAYVALAKREHFILPEVKLTLLALSSTQ